MITILCYQTAICSWKIYNRILGLNVLLLRYFSLLRVIRWILLKWTLNCISISNVFLVLNAFDVIYLYVTGAKPARKSWAKSLASSV